MKTPVKATARNRVRPLVDVASVLVQHTARSLCHLKQPIPQAPICYS